MATFLDRPNLHPKGLNHAANLPYGLRVAEIRAAMEDIYDFLYNVNRFLVGKGWDRLEETLLAATFSGVVSQAVVESISKQSAAVIRNNYHNGRPDLLPRGTYDGDAVHRGRDGIEVKASRHHQNWQGHNVENGWIAIFQYQVDVTTEPAEDRSPSRFVKALIAQLNEDDWSFSGRRETSRRTPTASINPSGIAKLLANPVYSDPTYAPLTRNARRAAKPPDEESP